MKPNLNFFALILSIIFGGNQDQINKTKNKKMVWWSEMVLKVSEYSVCVK